MIEAKPMRVAIASSQAITRRGLTTMVLSLKGAVLVGEAQDGEDALQLCERVKPDLLLLDLRNHLANGLEPARAIRLHCPMVKIVQLVSPHDEVRPPEDNDDLYYLSKEVSEDEFALVLREIYAGNLAVLHRTPSGSTRLEYLRQLIEELQNPQLTRSQLPEILSQFLPVIFPDGHIHVRLFPNQDLVAIPEPHSFPWAEVALRWLRTTSDPHGFFPGDEVPWGGVQEDDNLLITAPILQGKQSVGGICVLMPGERGDLPRIFSMLTALSEQIAGVILRFQSAVQPQTREVLRRELTMAGKIQADILPDREPLLEGWEFASSLEPARETSGDFYDFIPLSNRNLGFVIADVTDKGMGAALFMALTNTLIRTYATQYPTLPALAMGVVNERILSDTRGNMFVTAFYAVLEPHTGRLRYINAGHPPAYLLNLSKGRSVERLRPTGMALGVMENAYWGQKVVKINPGDVLVMYTDGVTEAQNSAGAFFGEARLVDVVHRLVHSREECTAQEIREAILDEVHQFVGERPRQDDIALIVMRRSPGS